jgi:hypothetical protein
MQAHAARRGNQADDEVSESVQAAESASDGSAGGDQVAGCRAERQGVHENGHDRKALLR